MYYLYSNGMVNISVHPLQSAQIGVLHEIIIFLTHVRELHTGAECTIWKSGIFQMAGTDRYHRYMPDLPQLKKIYIQILNNNIRCSVVQNFKQYLLIIVDDPYYK